MAKDGEKANMGIKQRGLSQDLEPPILWVCPPNPIWFFPENSIWFIMFLREMSWDIHLLEMASPNGPLDRWIPNWTISGSRFSDAHEVWDEESSHLVQKVIFWDLKSSQFGITCSVGQKLVQFDQFCQ